MSTIVPFPSGIRMETVASTSSRPGGIAEMSFPVLTARDDGSIDFAGAEDTVPIEDRIGDPLWIMTTAHKSSSDAETWKHALSMSDGLGHVGWIHRRTLEVRGTTFTLHTVAPPVDRPSGVTIRRGALGSFVACHGPDGPIDPRTLRDAVRAGIVLSGTHPHYHFHRCDDAPLPGSAIERLAYAGDEEPLRTYMDRRLSGMRTDGSIVRVVASKMTGPSIPSQMDTWCGVIEIASEDGRTRRTAVTCVLRSAPCAAKGHVFGYTDLREDHGEGGGRYPVDLMSMLDPPINELAARWRASVTKHLRNGFHTVG